mmetsp:Transcript_123022/g.274814  ORF Transcript_123022/g.274814 Transcript_123022/m.274814 type:complete len:91 (+) Transcript_123022:204-476(+)
MMPSRLGAVICRCILERMNMLLNWIDWRAQVPPTLETSALQAQSLLMRVCRTLLQFTRRVIGRVKLAVMDQSLSRSTLAILGKLSENART